jgi:hypothetical protein
MGLEVGLTSLQAYVWDAIEIKEHTPVVILNRRSTRIR